MNIKLNIEVNSGAAWILSFISVNAYGFCTKVAFSEFWVAIGVLFGWMSGRRLIRELKTPGGVSMTMPEDPEK